MNNENQLLRHANVATMCKNSTAYGLMNNASIAIENGLIAWVGPDQDTPEAYLGYKQQDLQGKLITPAFIDCHTHIVHGGHRAREFEMRLHGATYEEVSRAGGGINSTVRDTRAASEDSLLESALPRIDALLAEGVSTIEIKSGYGLNEATELNMLRAARRIAQVRPVRVLTSYLAAHAVPPEYAQRSDDYIQEVCIPTLHKAHAEGLVDAVDGFCENIAFSPEQIANVFDTAQSLNIPVKLHAEQLSNLGGAALAARYGALSADHLEYLDSTGVEAMAAANTTAVILPGAFYTLRETQYPPIALLREHGVSIAIATDSNPGSSPMCSLLLTMNMACTLFKLTPEEALAGVTREAAKALGLNDTGEITQGKRADLAIWHAEHPAELSYRIGFNALMQRIYSQSH